MRIQILGTAAAEAWPGLFCGCDICNRARAAGGKDLRSRASVQIDDVYKIDFPPDTYYHTIRHGIDLSHLKYLFFTHSHGDHYAPQELEYLRPGFAHNVINAPVQVFGNDRVAGDLQTRVQGHIDWPIEVRQLTPFEAVQADHIAFTPILAVHARGEQALNYVISSAGKTVLYASDTGLYEEQTMAFLAGPKFDLLIVECTQGTLDRPSHTHMGFEGVLELRRRLAAAESVSGASRWVITHFSHNMGLMHDEMEAVANAEGIEVAYDGIAFEV